MEKFIGMYEPYAYAILRIVAGLLFLCHGLQKVFGMFGGINGAAAPLSSLLGIAGLIELVCGPLIVVGLFTSYAAFIDEYPNVPDLVKRQTHERRTGRLERP